MYIYIYLSIYFCETYFKLLKVNNTSLTLTISPPQLVEILKSDWLRTNGVNTNGANAKVNNLDRLGKKVHPVAFGNIKVG